MYVPVYVYIGPYLSHQRPFVISITPIISVLQSLTVAAETNASSYHYHAKCFLGPTLSATFVCKVLESPSSRMETTAAGKVIQ